MEKPSWQEILGWEEVQIRDFRCMGYSYIKQGHYRIALKFFRILVVLPGENSYDFQTLGALYLQTGDYLQALHYLEHAITLDPSHESTLLNRAKALLMLGYKKQGLLQTNSLEKSANATVANQARALTLAYQ